MSEGLVAPTWSDAGPVPVGEVIEAGSVKLTYVAGDVWRMEMPFINGTRFTMDVNLTPLPAIKPSDPNAKPSLPALGKVAGEEYRGLGWCDE